MNIYEICSIFIPLYLLIDFRWAFRFSQVMNSNLILGFLTIKLLNELTADYVKVESDPGTDIWCVMTPGNVLHVSCPEACPLTCERVLPGDPTVVARYNKNTHQCECFDAFGVCELPGNTTDPKITYYIDGEKIEILMR